MLSLEQILRDKLIPWSDNAGERVIVARTKMTASALPSGVRLEKRQLKGKREVVKNRRIYQNTRALSALWPDCGLNEVNLLKLACVISGAVDFQLGRQAVLCGPGHFIVIPSGMPHPDGTQNIINFSESTFCEILYFLLYPNALQCWIHRYEDAKTDKWQVENYLFRNERLVQLFRIFMEEAISQPRRLKLNGTLFQALIYLLRGNLQDGFYMETLSGETNPLLQEAPSPEDFLHRLNHYIQSHLQERPTLQSAARAMYLSRTQLARRVRAETGKTYLGMVNEQRLETAKELLVNTDWTVSNIATFIGYKTPHYFHLYFRRETGMTPNEFRKATRKKECD